MLHGDETGSLLGADAAARAAAAADGAASPARSSRRGCWARSPRPRAAATPQTLTGFKWISRVEGLVYGYEEALGYCVDPAHVRDKDGISAALLVADLAARLKAEGRTLIDALDDLAARARPAPDRPGLRAVRRPRPDR